MACSNIFEQDWAGPSGLVAYLKMKWVVQEMEKKQVCVYDGLHYALRLILGYLYYPHQRKYLETQLTLPVFKATHCIIVQHSLKLMWATSEYADFCDNHIAQNLELCNIVIRVG